MSLDDWVSCPHGCDDRIEVVALPENRVGIRCYGCHRKIEEPVAAYEPHYRLLSDS